jgi:hypothetical protein
MLNFADMPRWKRYLIATLLTALGSTIPTQPTVVLDAIERIVVALAFVHLFFG